MLFFAVTIVAYILFFIIPADPARQVAGKGATPETVAKARVYLGLDKPIYARLQVGIDADHWHADVFNPPPGQAGGPVQWAYHLILPWMTFMILFAALYVRMIRANVIETLNEDYVRTARGNGASEWTVMRRHVLRNVMLPVVTILGMDIGLALGGAIFTETVYSLPGLGRTSVQALANHDVPTVLGVIVFATIVIITFNLVVDILYAWIDPRIRLT
jgi:ABC-type dipeptide/oligopeptide/nickel transport system permease component